MPDPVFTSALAGIVAPPGLSISIREIADCGMLDLRGDVSDPAFRRAVESALGIVLPVKPRTTSPSPLTGEGWGGGGPQTRASPNPITIFWLSIDQWLILCPCQDAPRLTADLGARLAGVHSLLVDVSDARAILRLEGEGVREVLMKGVPVDLISPDYRPGAVRRVRFAEIAALLHIVQADPEVIDLYVFRSHAAYAWEWLLATAREPARLRLFGAQPAPTV